MPQPPDVAVLCGGLGSRLRGVLGDQPKALADIGGRPFLDFLIETIVAEGLRRIILCTGQGRNLIRSRIPARLHGAEIIFSEETSPLGTGGALRHCLPHIQSRRLLLLNGDSYTRLSLEAFWRRGEQADQVLLAVVPAHGRDDAGNVHVNERGIVTAFYEKIAAASPGYISAGIYLLARTQLEAIPGPGSCSIEYDLIPQWICHPGINAFIADAEVIDIGTPARLMVAREKLNLSLRTVERPEMQEFG